MRGESPKRRCANSEAQAGDFIPSIKRSLIAASDLVVLQISNTFK